MYESVVWRNFSWYILYQKGILLPHISANKSNQNLGNLTWHLIEIEIIFI